MRTHFIAAVAFTGALALSQFASAADGNISFNGEITGQTCVINGGNKDIVVTLPTVAASTLSATGKTAGKTPFSIDLTGCAATPAKVQVQFEPGATVDSTTGRLIPAPGGATNVQVGLSNADDASAIKLGLALSAQNSRAADIVNGAASLRYTAEYVASGGAATVGKVTTSVVYSIAYQ
ncbi:Laminin-binding fimbrial subunit ElfA precursor [compost metagenome]